MTTSPTPVLPPDAMTAEALRARLAALSEVHDAYHFDGYTTEEQFDLYLHRLITEVRARLGFGTAGPPPKGPPSRDDMGRQVHPPSSSGVPANSRPGAYRMGETP